MIIFGLNLQLKTLRKLKRMWLSWFHISDSICDQRFPLESEMGFGIQYYAKNLIPLKWDPSIVALFGK